MTNRYDRQIRFDAFGEQGQNALQRASVLVLGAGALGSAASEMLVRAGVGELRIVDRDVIELSNLHRQQLYDEEDVAQQLPKAIAAKSRLEAINSNVIIEAEMIDVTRHNVESLLDGVTAVIDATDNIETRLLMNDATWKRNIPFFMGAGVASYGITFPIGIRREEPCLHCLIDTLPSETGTCDTIGVISPTTISVAARQVTQLLKFLRLGDFQPKLQSFDLWKDEQASIQVTALKRPNCPTCGEEATFPYLSGALETTSSVLCGRDTVQLSWPSNRDVHLPTIEQTLRKETHEVLRNNYLVSATLPEHRLVFFKDGRILVHGTGDERVAKNLIAQFFG